MINVQSSTISVGKAYLKLIENTLLVIQYDL